MAEKRPKYFSDCIDLAMKKFYKLFRDNILQLILVYPLDKLNADGRPFWSLPKRAPTAQSFNPEDPLHRNFVASQACLLARMYKIEIPYDQPRSEDAKLAITEIAKLFEPGPFIPNAEKAKLIQSQVEKDQKGGKDTEDKNEAAASEPSVEESKSASTVMIDTSGSKSNDSIDRVKERFAQLV